MDLSTALGQQRNRCRACLGCLTFCFVEFKLFHEYKSFLFYSFRKIWKAAVAANVLGKPPVWNRKAVEKRSPCSRLLDLGVVEWQLFTTKLRKSFTERRIVFTSILKRNRRNVETFFVRPSKGV